VQSGTLTIMVGGDPEAYKRVEPILRELGTPHHIGENGHGLVLKLAINISLAVQMLAFSEGLLLADRAGIDRKRAVDVMTESPIGSPMLKARAELVLDLPVRRRPDAEGHRARARGGARAQRAAALRRDRRRGAHVRASSRLRAP
jgi:3-hydroxyisobutyrate dehydrogenase-like beta-hydroxyacid dehydrogenase